MLFLQFHQIQVLKLYTIEFVMNDKMFMK